ncbi:hypothetical protein, partial [Streptomyces durbertensis]|uniref:hypothetical protein n=1 Tax=Streptomyces durbertensis TaxID=2448886 RepID=UPI001E48FDFD
RGMDGVSTYLALTFGTLLSSQGTDASFGFPSGLPPGASLRCFQPYQSFSGPFHRAEFTLRALDSRLPFGASRLYQKLFR